MHITPKTMSSNKSTIDKAVDQVNGKTPDKCVSKPPAAYPNPTPEQLKSKEFEAVWQLMKSWDIAVPEWYDGYTGAMGNHVAAVLKAIAEAK